MINNNTSCIKCVDGINTCVYCSEKLLIEISKLHNSTIPKSTSVRVSVENSYHGTQYLIDNENTINTIHTNL